MFSRKKKVRNPIVVKGMGAKTHRREEEEGEEQHELKEGIKKKSNVNKSCILCVGSAGSGKTATVERCLGVSISGSPAPEAGQFRIYQPLDETRPVWVELAGESWEDKHWEDALALQENLLQFLYNQGVSELSAVVWNIIPGGASSRDPRKERQAEFINMLWPKRVWGAVVVVCKESARPERDAAEATRLAEEYSAFRRPKVVGFRLLVSFADNERREELERDEEKRREFNAATDEEARQRLEAALSECQEDGEGEALRLFSRMGEGEEDEGDLEDLFLDPKEEKREKFWMGMPPVVYAKPY